MIREKSDFLHEKSVRIWNEEGKAEFMKDDEVMRRTRVIMVIEFGEE